MIFYCVGANIREYARWKAVAPKSPELLLVEVKGAVWTMAAKSGSFSVMPDVLDEIDRVEAT